MASITNIEDLLFPVELRPLYTDLEIDGMLTKIKVPNSRIVVNKTTGNLLGVVGINYKLIKNEEAIALGKKCCIELFGNQETENIEIFFFFSHSTASYCHIDLIHKSYVMNLWDEKNSSDVYIPYVRVTNSYNTSRALRFDVGFCRKICFNGVIFETETIQFKFYHIKHKLTDEISFTRKNEKIGALFNRFKSYATSLKEFEISKEDSLHLILTLFKIKRENEIDFDNKKNNRSEYKSLIENVEQTLGKYIGEIGKNGYSLFNVITDIASHSIENRYFRRDINSMQRLAGNWINSFHEEIAQSDFNINEYISRLQESPQKTLHMTANHYSAITPAEFAQ